MTYTSGIGIGRLEKGEVNAVIEVPQGSRVKYELDKASGMIRVDRILHASMIYPFNYGFVPETLCEDGDPSDVLVMGHEPLLPGTVVSCAPIGLLVMEDENGPDNKVLAVPTATVDSRFKEVSGLKDLPEQTPGEIRHFFERYKELEKGKWVKVVKWMDAKHALAELRRSHSAFLKKRE